MPNYEFEYYYASELDEYDFFRIPKLLFIEDMFKSISNEAKLLYGLMLDRIAISRKNNWIDKQGRLYIYFTLDEVANIMSCSKKKGAKLLAELDSIKGIGLIERRKQGLGNMTMIYVKNFIASVNASAAENINQSILTKHFSEKKEKTNNAIEAYNAYREIIKDNIDYHLLAANNVGNGDVDDIVELMLETICTTKKYIKIMDEDIPAEIVKNRLIKLNHSHIEHVIDCLKKNTTNISNNRSYMLSALYNSTNALNHSYQVEVSHELFN